MTNDCDLNCIVDMMNSSSNFQRSYSIVSLDDLVLDTDDQTLVQLSRKRFSSSLSLTHDSVIVSDDEFSCCDSDKRSIKRSRTVKKTVRFADEYQGNTCCNVLQQTRSIPVLVNDNYNELFWSKKELHEFQEDCKLMQSTDFEVQEYIQAFRQVKESVMIQSNDDDDLRSCTDFEILLDGLSDGWRGLECFGTSYALLQKSRTRKFVQTVIALQQSCTNDEKLAEQVTALSLPSVRWSITLGTLAHQTTTS